MEALLGISYRRLMRNKINSDPHWKLLDEMFVANYLKASDRVEKIPRRIHQIWLGGGLPDSYKPLQATWVEKHKDWDYKLWGDDDVEGLGLARTDAFRNARTIGARSDILKYEILYKYGGIYVDTDFECIRSFDDFVHLEFFAGTGHMYEVGLFTGLIGSIRGHDLLRNAIEGLVVREDSHDETLASTGPEYFSRCVLDYVRGKPDRIVIFPTVFFYPFPAELRENIRPYDFHARKLVRSYLHPRYSYAVHLWHTAWQGQT